MNKQLNEYPMAIKKILTYPDPVLRQKVETVTSFDDSLRQLAKDLAETMFAAPGAGLGKPDRRMPACCGY